MACFAVPAAEAVVVTVVIGVMMIKEKKAALERVHIDGASPEAGQTSRFPFLRKLKWLASMLWGGSFLLAYEHIWHGEVVPWFPFLTAASDPESTSEMLHEMGTVGVTMALLVTGVWLGMVAVSHFIEKRNRTVSPAVEANEV